MGSLIVEPKLELLKVPVFAVDMVKTYGRVPLWKVDEQTHTVYGLSTAELPDSDREVADYVDSAKYYMQWGDETAKRTRDAGQQVSYGNIRLQHTGQIAGAARRIDLIPEKRSIWLLTQPVDDDIWNQLAGGFLTGYSHAGRYAYRRCFECNYDLPSGNYCPQCHKEQLVRYAPILTEVSYVDRPCLPDAVFAYVKADGKTEMRKFAAPETKKVLVDIRELAQTFTANFMLAVEELEKRGINRATGAPPEGDGSNINDFLDAEKRARNPVGQFANNASGPAHDAAVASGYEHTRTGSAREGSADPVASRSYTHASGARLSLCEDGRWSHEDGKGRTTTGTGVEALSSHLAACHTKKAESAPDAGKDTTTMEDAAVQKLVKDSVTEMLSAAFGVRFVDGKVVPVEVPAQKKAVKKDEIECPDCGDMITFDPDDDEDSVDCPECGRTVSIKSAKALKVVKVIVAFQKDMSHISRLAEILQQIRYLQQYVAWEGESERDFRDFAIAEDLGGLLTEGVDILNALVEDETSELTQPLAALAVPALKAASNNKERNTMRADELLNKAASGLKKYFGKAAACHEKVAKMHKAMADESTEKMAKAEGEAKAELEKKFNFDKAAADHHEKMAQHCKDAAESMGSEEAKADTPVDLTKALGDTQAALSTAIDAKLAPITKALSALDGIATLGERMGKVEAAVEKFGNETLPTVVKGAGSQLISREGKVMDPIATTEKAADFTNLFK